MLILTFAVDRVLRHQQAEKDKQAARERQLVSEISKATGNMGGQQPPPGQPPPKTEIVSNDQSPGPSKGGGLFSNFKLRKPVKPGSSPTPSMPGGTPEPPNPVAPYGKGPVWNADQGVTPHANIERNVRSAIDVSALQIFIPVFALSMCVGLSSRGSRSHPKS